MFLFSINKREKRTSGQKFSKLSTKCYASQHFLKTISFGNDDVRSLEPLKQSPVRTGIQKERTSQISREFGLSTQLCECWMRFGQLVYRRVRSITSLCNSCFLIFKGLSEVVKYSLNKILNVKFIGSEVLMSSTNSTKFGRPSSYAIRRQNIFFVIF